MYNNEQVEKTSEGAIAGIGSYLAGVYYWMSFALGISGLCAWLVGTSPQLTKFFIGNTLMMIVLILLELGLVIGIGALINKISAATATALFIAYSALSGITLSTIFLVYSMDTIGSAFFTTALTFGALAVYGSVTKRDLTTLGSICSMALIGLIIASVVNIFFANSTLYWIITYLGVLIFVGLTAYDAQMVKQMYLASDGTPEDLRKRMILGALALYLDFINLFLMLLRIFGGRRD